MTSGRPGDTANRVFYVWYTTKKNTRLHWWSSVNNYFIQEDRGNFNSIVSMYGATVLRIRRISISYKQQKLSLIHIAMLYIFPNKIKYASHFQYINGCSCKRYPRPCHACLNPWTTSSLTTALAYRLSSTMHYIEQFWIFGMWALGN